jgi:hypothetical protein
MIRRLAAAVAALILMAAGPLSALAASGPTEWDGLVKVKAKKFQAVYLLPGADFKPYTKIMMDPTEVDFQKNWLRDYNRSTTMLSAKISDADAAKGLQKVRTGFEKIFVKAYADAGYQVVTTPGPDVLRLRTGVVNLRVNAPDRMTAGRTRSYAPEAGQATLVLEARDSTSGALLGRALDNQLAGDMGPYVRNSVTNQADFERLFQTWAKASVQGLNRLKASAPTQ